MEREVGPPCTRRFRWEAKPRRWLMRIGRRARRILPLQWFTTRYRAGSRVDYRLHTVSCPSPVKNLINRHRGGLLSAIGSRVLFLLLLLLFSVEEVCRTYTDTYFVCNLFESDREVYSNFPASVPHFHIVSTSFLHARHISNFIRLGRKFIDYRAFCNQKEKGDEFLERFPI